MANLDRIVNVQISLDTSGVSKEGFSTLLIVGATTRTTNRVDSYTNINQMTDDGYEVTDPIYLAASDAFAQTPRPRLVKIGHRLVPSFTVSVPDPVEGTYSVTISRKDGAQEYKYEAADSADTPVSQATILNGLKEAINGHQGLKAEVQGSTLTVSNNTDHGAFSYVHSQNLEVADGTPTETIAESMSAIMGADNDFYGIVLASRNEDDIKAMATWTETQTKLFGFSTDAAAVYDQESTEDIGAWCQDQNLYRTFWFYHSDAATDYPETAVMARCFAIDPGGETWANKKLAGVTADGLTETQYIAITKKSGNTFEKFRNLAITQNGKVAAGEWIDVIRFRDWLQEEITVNVFNVLVNSDKVPYTDAGIAMIEAQIRASLSLGQDRGGIAPTEYDEDGNANVGYTLTVPLASNIPAGTKASRILEDVEFTARLAGAIHAIDITGHLTYDKLTEVA